MCLSPTQPLQAANPLHPSTQTHYEGPDRVWNKGIGWKYTYGSINIWYGIVVLGGNFLKINELVRRKILLDGPFFTKL